jgi:hypothetical protein
VVTCGIFETERERELKSEEGGCVAVIFFSFQSGLLPRIGEWRHPGSYMPIYITSSYMDLFLIKNSRLLG